MRLIEQEVSEDGYEGQIVMPKEKRDLAADEGISNKRFLAPLEMTDWAEMRITTQSQGNEVSDVRPDPIRPRQLVSQGHPV